MLNNYMSNFPFYYAVIGDNDTGVASISLVENPAVEVEWLLFSKDAKSKIMFSVNNEKKEINGVIMLADTPIYREGRDGKPYWVVYSKETIKKMALKMLNKDNTYGNIDTEHNGVLLKGNALELAEIYIKDTEKGTPTMFPQITEGSLVATYKVNDDAIWEECISGKYKGFSLSGLFNMSEITDRHVIDKYNKQLTKRINGNMNFSAILKKVLLKYSEVTASDGSVWILDGDLVEGASPVDNDGNAIPDGTYEVEGKDVTIKDGVVESITDKQPLEAMEAMEEEPTYAKTSDIEALTSQVSELRALVEDLTSKINDMESKLSEPLTDPITEEYEKVNNNNLSGAARILRSLKH